MVIVRSVTPVLRMFDEMKAKDFYIGFLGFQADWEHRFEAGLPLYMQISLSDCVLHLSELYGDACPGSSIRVQVDGLEQFHQQLLNKNDKYARPGLETTPWRTKEVRVIDPFGNKVIFYENIEA